MSKVELKLDDVTVYTSGAVVTPPGPTPPPPTTPPPPPPPIPTGGLARFDSVPGDSDFARWTFWQSSEFAPLLARLMATRGWDEQAARNRINTQINAYAGGGINLPGSYNMARNTYMYYALFDLRVMLDDINGAADAYIAQHFPGRLPLGELR